MATHRSYIPQSKFPEYEHYHKTLNRFRANSPIISSGNKPVWESFIDDSLQSLKNLLLTREGNEQGIYYKNNEPYQAYLVLCDERLAKIKKEWKNAQQEARNEGKEFGKEMPPEMLEKRLKWEAERDGCLEEIDLINERITNFVETKKKLDDSKVLLHGLQGAGNFWGTKAPSDDLINVLKTIDGQEVRVFEPEQILIIDDERSPYNRMSVVDYRRFIKEFAITRQQELDEKHKLYKAKCIAEGKPVPRPKVPDNLRHWEKKDLPPFPEWAKKYIAEPEPEEEEYPRKHKYDDTKHIKLKR